MQVDWMTDVAERLFASKANNSRAALRMKIYKRLLLERQDRAITL
jgi:hypothetical protein